MGLNWNEIKSRALLFSKTWADASHEDSEAKPFWLAFFEIFGITDKRVATFELNVKKLGGAQGYVDLFWPGVLLVELNASPSSWIFTYAPPACCMRKPSKKHEQPNPQSTDRKEQTLPS